MQAFLVILDSLASKNALVEDYAAARLVVRLLHLTLHVFNMKYFTVLRCLLWMPLTVHSVSVEWPMTVSVDSLVCIDIWHGVSPKIRYYVDLLRSVYITVSKPEERLKEHV